MKFAKIWACIQAFPSKYSTATHLAIVVWGAFLTSWETKGSVTIDGLSVNASSWISQAQAFFHAPTWAVGAVAFTLNLILFYGNFKTLQQNKQS